MLSANQLPKALVVGTFVLSGVVATTGATSAALGVVDTASDAPCPDVDQDKPAKGILDCLERSTAYISTSIASGSGLVLDDHYVLTNAHVVDPFDAVDVTIDGHRHRNVKVLGVDSFADIAVLGPFDTDAPPVHLGDRAQVAELGQGDPLFLVGYPGEANDKDLQATIADGILSRTRHSDEFHLDYLQSDASIGGGQSGGALVGSDGTVLGITSAKLDDSYALAVSAADASAAVGRIIKGKGSPYLPWPGGDLVGAATLHLDGLDQPAVFTIMPAAETRQVELTVPADVPLMLQSGSLEDGEGEAGGNFAAIAAAVADVPYEAIANASYEELTQFVPDDVDLAEQVRPGVFRFEVPADTHMSFAVVSFADDPIDVPFSSSVEGAVLELKAPTDVKVGDDPVESVMASALPYDLYDVHLTKGQQVRIHAGAPSGDMWVSVYGPGMDDSEEYDDSRTGLYGVDVDETFTAPQDGTYELQVGSNDQSSVGYHLALTEPSDSQRNK